MLTYLKKWFGRKALYPILFALLVAVNAKVFGSILTEAQLGDISNLILAFILGEAAIDGIRVYVDAKKQKQ